MKFSFAWILSLLLACNSNFDVGSGKKNKDADESVEDESQNKDKESDEGKESIVREKNDENSQEEP